jgi:hypothetical protein
MRYLTSNLGGRSDQERQIKKSKETNQEGKEGDEEGKEGDEEGEEKSERLK